MSKKIIMFSGVLSAILTASLTYMVNKFTIAEQYSRDIELLNIEAARRFDELEVEQRNNMEVLKLSMESSAKITLNSLSKELNNEKRILSIKRNEYYQKEMIQYLLDYNEVYFSLVDFYVKEYVNSHYASFKYAFNMESILNNKRNKFSGVIGIEEARTNPFDVKGETFANISSKAVLLISKCGIYFDEDVCKNIRLSLSELEKFQYLKIDFIVSESVAYQDRIRSSLKELKELNGVDINATNVKNEDVIEITNMVFKMVAPMEALYGDKMKDILKSKSFDHYNKSVRSVRERIVSVFDE